MAKFKIFIDSTGDLPKELRDKYGRAAAERVKSDANEIWGTKHAPPRFSYIKRTLILIYIHFFIWKRKTENVILI